MSAPFETDAKGSASASKRTYKQTRRNGRGVVFMSVAVSRARPLQNENVTGGERRGRMAKCRGEWELRRSARLTHEGLQQVEPKSQALARAVPAKSSPGLRHPTGPFPAR